MNHVFSTVDKTATLRHRVYQNTMKLIRFRASLAHPKFIHRKVARRGPPPILFDHVNADYPAARVLEIATNFKDSLLKDVDLKDASGRQGFISPPPGADGTCSRA